MQPTDRTRTGFGAYFRLFSIHSEGFFLLLLATRPYGETQDERGYTFDAGAGLSPLVSDISTRLDNGWHVTFGGGYNFTSHFTTTLNYAYHGFGVSNKVLAEAN